MSGVLSTDHTVYLYCEKQTAATEGMHADNKGEVFTPIWKGKESAVDEF